MQNNKLDQSLQSLISHLKGHIPCDNFIIKYPWQIRLINIDEAFWKEAKSGVEFMANALGCDFCEAGETDGEEVWLISRD